MSILWEPRYAPTEPSREQEDLSDALGQDLLQTYLEMAYANYIHLMDALKTDSSS